MNTTHSPFLFGEHELTLDSKGRLLIPAEVRKSIDVATYGEAFFGLIGVNRRVWLYPDRYYQTRLDASEADMTPGDAVVDFNHVNFAMTARFELDKQGRILLDEKLIRRTGLLREVTVVGARDHLELWNRADWEARFEELLNRPGDVASQHRQAKQQSAGPSKAT